VAYVLWALGALGLGGLHRFYLGRRTSGWVYLLTLDLVFVGLLLDYKLIPAMVDEANRALRLPPDHSQAHLPNIVVNIAAPAVTAPRVIVHEVIKEVVKIRCSYCGQLTNQGTPKCDECGART